MANRIVDLRKSRIKSALDYWTKLASIKAGDEVWVSDAGTKVFIILVFASSDVTVCIKGDED